MPNGHSVKVIKKTLAAAAKQGYVVLSYNKEFHMFKVEHQMSIQSMSFDQLSTVAFPHHATWR